MRDDEQVPLPEEHVELEVEDEDGGRGGDDEGGEGGAERQPLQEVVGGAALRLEALCVRAGQQSILAHYFLRGNPIPGIHCIGD